MSRRRMIALLGMVAAVGCENMGLDYAGPAEEAALRPPSALVAAVIPPAVAADERGLIVDGRLWLPSGSALGVDEKDVRTVGSANGRTVYAHAWDQAPYDRLFTRHGGASSAAGGAAGGGESAGGAAVGGEAVDADAVSDGGPAPAGGYIGGAPGTGAAAPRGSMVVNPEEPRWMAYLPVIGGGGGPRASAGLGPAATGEGGGH